eukprot:725738-Rhodomonas_salina.1
MRNQRQRAARCPGSAAESRRSQLISHLDAGKLLHLRELLVCARLLLNTPHLSPAHPPHFAAPCAISVPLIAQQVH